MEAAGWLRKLESHIAGVRSHAAWQLGRLRETGAVPALIRLLESDESEDVRLTAAWALGELGDVRAVPALEAASERDASADVSSQAREALRALGAELRQSGLVEP